ncbi:Tm-1-like ATP-binding domain-containing protein [Dictyobacter formicarum]|uniref:UPF0261 domain-containing protein n=1 Tax=Dictyobacter formicarum TaxID=2778368 RepID=A0ABQ3VIM4_9CHLR|nr:Tm-1-like ATP-binding domain-containing protein [Dictyobacter formicarum]GHO84976.1 hypothetical protein KSZ_29820 [Dictyobacter formicarum]
MTTVVLLGTLDTRGLEYAYVRDCIQAAQCKVVLMDAGSKGVPQIQPDISREAVARAAHIDIAQLEHADQTTAIKMMAKGATAMAVELFARGRLHGIMAIGGGGGSRLATSAMKALPLGVPKLLVSSLASGDVRPFVGAMDISIMYSVVEITSINVVTERILTNAAAAIASMALAYDNFELSARARLHPYLTHPPIDRVPASSPS